MVFTTKKCSCEVKQTHETKYLPVAAVSHRGRGTVTVRASIWGIHLRDRLSLPPRGKAFYPLVL